MHNNVIEIAKINGLKLPIFGIYGATSLVRLSSLIFLLFYSFKIFFWSLELSFFGVDLSLKIRTAVFMFVERDPLRDLLYVAACLVLIAIHAIIYKYFLKKAVKFVSSLIVSMTIVLYNRFVELRVYLISYNTGQLDFCIKTGSIPPLISELPLFHDRWYHAILELGYGGYGFDNKNHPSTNGTFLSENSNYLNSETEEDFLEFFTINQSLKKFMTLHPSIGKIHPLNFPPTLFHHSLKLGKVCYHEVFDEVRNELFVSFTSDQLNNYMALTASAGEREALRFLLSAIAKRTVRRRFLLWDAFPEVNLISEQTFSEYVSEVHRVKSGKGFGRNKHPLYYTRQQTDGMSSH